MRFEVKQVGEFWRVWDTKNEYYITVDIPDKLIAEEICDDFNSARGPLFIDK